MCSVGGRRYLTHRWDPWGVPEHWTGTKYLISILHYVQGSIEPAKVEVGEFRQRRACARCALMQIRTVPVVD